MGRTAITIGTSDGRPSILDRSGDGSIHFEQATSGDSTSGAPGTGSLLPATAGKPRQTSTLEETITGQEVILNDIWAQLSLPDRQCFGHRFSGMVLKALGLRPCSEKEVET